MRIFAILTLGLLAACSSEGEDRQAVFDRATAAQNMLNEIRDLSPTSERRMPSTGTATFDGYATIRVSALRGTDADDVLLLGLSHLEVDFNAPGPVTGSISDLDALIPRGTGNELQEVDGMILIGNSNSIISGNQWSANYNGTLGIDGDPTIVRGTVDGQFLVNRTSDPDNLIKATIGGDTNGIALPSSGGVSTVELYIYGTNP